MQFRLRTLLIVLALGPPLLAALWLDCASVVMTAAFVLCLAEVVKFIRVNTPGRYPPSSNN